jgi:hypothetical protein
MRFANCSNSFKTFMQFKSLRTRVASETFLCNLKSEFL